MTSTHRIMDDYLTLREYVFRHSHTQCTKSDFCLHEKSLIFLQIPQKFLVESLKVWSDNHVCICLESLKVKWSFQYTYFINIEGMSIYIITQILKR